MPRPKSNCFIYLQGTITAHVHKTEHQVFEVNHEMYDLLKNMSLLVLKKKQRILILLYHLSVRLRPQISFQKFGLF